MIDVKELNILNRKNCICGNHGFTLADVKSVEPLQDAHGFYGNLVKHYAKIECPVCHRKTILLLKQAGQSWDIMNTAVTNDMNKTIVVQTKTQIAKVQPEITNKEEKNNSNEFICPVCKKVCKSKIGLNSHMKTHQN